MKDKEDSSPHTLSDKVIKISRASQIANMIMNSIAFAEQSANASKGTPMEAFCDKFQKAVNAAAAGYQTMSCKVIVNATDEVVAIAKDLTKIRTGMDEINEAVAGDGLDEGAQPARLEDIIESLKGMSRKFKGHKKEGDS